MSGKKVKRYIDEDVYTMAKKRIRHIVEIFDSILVAFSGGKDSLTVLNLVQEVYDEMGITQKVKVFFRDEELIPDNVIDFVKSLYESGKYDFRYYAIPLKSNKFILGKTYDYIQWDNNRKWLRQPPDYAIRSKDNKVYDQYDADTFICSGEKGKVAILTGIRADESLVRLRATINKRNENYINATKDRRIKLCKPIYDWTERDVFLYFYKNNIKYCPIYDLELLNGEGLRVSTPLHAESSKRFNKIRTRDPLFYQQLIDLFPEMLVQERYYREFGESKEKIYSKYSHDGKGIRQYIYENITDKGQQELALRRLESALHTRASKIKGSNNFGGYPYRHIFDAIVTGAFKRAIGPKGKASLQDFLFEGLTEEDYNRAKESEQ